MIDDLIDLYYYIRSTEHVNSIKHWGYKTASFKHEVIMYPIMNPMTRTLLIKIKVAVGTDNYYRMFRIQPERLEMYETSAYVVSLPHAGKLTEDEIENLKKYISTEEIEILCQIYIELDKLYTRST